MMVDLYTWPASPTRWDLINHCIQKFDYQRYLEIGCANNQCFNNVVCTTKVGVDPTSGGTHRMTSDEFFTQNDETFDIVFVDGLHVADQAYRDVINAFQYLTPGGTVVMHDCIPVNEGMQKVPRVQTSWTGDVWKAAVKLRTHSDLDLAVALIDAGVGVVRKRKNPNPLQLSSNAFRLTWDDFVSNHRTWLNVMSYDAVLDWL